MNARLLILIAVAGILAVGLAFRPMKPTDNLDIVGTVASPENKTSEQIREEKVPFILRDPPPGDTPSEPPVFHVDVAVDRASGKNRLVFHVTEEHGYYVERPAVQFWYTDGTIEDPEDSPLQISQPFELYLKANDTLSHCIEIVKPELDNLGGDIGTTDNWKARVYFYGRYRAANPDPLPAVGSAGACD